MSQEILSSWGIIPLFYLLNMRCFFPMTLNLCISFSWFTSPFLSSFSYFAYQQQLKLWNYFEFGKNPQAILKFANAFSKRLASRRETVLLLFPWKLFLIYMRAYSAGIPIWPTLNRSNSVNARADFLHWELLRVEILSWFSIVLTCSEVSWSKLNVHPDFNSGKSSSVV